VGLYRKRPVVIEATRWRRLGDHPEVKLLVEKPALGIPGLDCEGCGISLRGHGSVDTLEGHHIVCPGDWIIRGVEGEFYPCKNGIFLKTYEAVD